MSTNASQGGLPPIETSDIKPVETEPTKAPDPKAAETKTDDKSPKNDKGEKGKAPAKEKGPGPWEAELDKRGLRTPEIDAYMREVVQPYITQLEGKGGGSEYDTLFEGDYERAEMAAELMRALIDDPATAYKELGELLDLSAASNDAPPVPGAPPADPAAPPEGDPGMPEDERLQWVEQEMQRRQQEQEDQEYNELLSELEAKVPGFDPDGYHLAVLAARGDMEQAFRYYMDKVHREPAPTPEPPPPVLGDAPGNTPPRPSSKGGLDGAISETFAEMQAARRR
jgi:hypothetical protein